MAMKVEVDDAIVSPETFQKVLEFYAMNEYQTPEVATPIRTNDLRTIIDNKNYQFIKNYEPHQPEFYRLLKAAEYLVCNGLKKMLAAVIACRIYFEDSKDAYQKKKIELGVTQTISFQDEERYRQTYVFDSEK